MGLVFDGARLADRIIEIDVFLFAQRVNVIFKQLAQSLRANEIHKDENILAKWGRQFGWARTLFWPGEHPFFSWYCQRDLSVQHKVVLAISWQKPCLLPKVISIFR